MCDGNGLSLPYGIVEWSVKGLTLSYIIRIVHQNACLDDNFENLLLLWSMLMLYSKIVFEIKFCELYQNIIT